MTFNTSRILLFFSLPVSTFFFKNTVFLITINGNLKIQEVILLLLISLKEKVNNRLV